MNHTFRAPEGAEHLRNWAAQLLCEKGHKVEAPEILDGIMKTPVDDTHFLTNREVVDKANEYPEWGSRKRLHLNHLNEYQSSLAG